MIDSDNVLLLRPAREASGFPLVENGERPPPGETDGSTEGLVVVTLYYLDGPAGADFVDLFERNLRPVLEDAGAPVLASFVTESAANNCPALPVREGERVFAWFSRFLDRAAYDRRGAVQEVLAPRLERPPEVLRLSPTVRSLLRG